MMTSPGALGGLRLDGLVGTGVASLHLGVAVARLDVAAAVLEVTRDAGLRGGAVPVPAGRAGGVSDGGRAARDAVPAVVDVGGAAAVDVALALGGGRDEARREDGARGVVAAEDEAALGASDVHALGVVLDAGVLGGCACDVSGKFYRRANVPSATALRLEMPAS